jgi:phosphohistidine phosphatase SixA
MLTALRALALSALLLTWLGSPRIAHADEAALLRALRSGAVAVLVRHAQTEPGTGDPPGFRLQDCATQRNLSEAGRAQAQRIGAWFKSRGITPTIVRNSLWCRARDTARLAFGRSEDWDALANVFEDRTQERRHTNAVRAFVAQLKEQQVAVLVSHGATIASVTGVQLARGEGIVVRARAGKDGPLVEVIGRITVP